MTSVARATPSSQQSEVQLFANEHSESTLLSMSVRCLNSCVILIVYINSFKPSNASPGKCSDCSCFPKRRINCEVRQSRAAR